jgi:hypothetical protein
VNIAYSCRPRLKARRERKKVEYFEASRRRSGSIWEAETEEDVNSPGGGIGENRNDLGRLYHQKGIPESWEFESTR